MLGFKLKSEQSAHKKLDGSLVGKTIIHYLSNTDKSTLCQVYYMQSAVLKPTSGEYVRLNHRWYKVDFIANTYTAEGDYMVQNVYCYVDYFSDNASPSDPRATF
jgi:hypothetical protein